MVSKKRKKSATAEIPQMPPTGIGNLIGPFEPAEVRENARRDRDLASLNRRAAAEVREKTRELGAIKRRASQHDEHRAYGTLSAAQELQTDFSNPRIGNLVILAYQSLSNPESIHVLGDVVIETQWYNRYMLTFGYTHEESMKCAANPPNIPWARAVLAALTAEITPYIPAHPNSKPIQRYALPFPSITLPPRSRIESVYVQPQTTISPNRLIIDPSVHGAVMVHDLVIGNVSAIISGGGIPASNFGPNAVEIELYMPTMTPVNVARLSVSNISDREVTFSACLFGLAHETNVDRPLYGLDPVVDAARRL